VIFTSWGCYLLFNKINKGTHMKKIALLLVVSSAFIISACNKAPESKAPAESAEPATMAPAAGEAPMEAAPTEGTMTEPAAAETEEKAGSEMSGDAAQSSGDAAK
jgi:hypothetical protein